QPLGAWNELRLPVQELAVVRCGTRIEKDDEAAVSHERHDAVCLVASEFQAADPDEDDNQSQPQHAHAEAVEPRSFDVEAPDWGNARRRVSCASRRILVFVEHHGCLKSNEHARFVPGVGAVACTVRRSLAMFTSLTS